MWETVETSAREIVVGEAECYGSRLKGLSQETTLVLSNTRELDRELFYKLVYFI